MWEPAYVRTYMCSSKDNIQPWESGFLLPDLRRKVTFFQHLGPGVRTGLSFFVGSIFTWNAVSRIFSVISFTKFFWPTNLGCQRLLSNVPRTFPSFNSPLHVTDIPFQIDDLLASLTPTGSCKSAQCLEVTRQWAFVGLFRILTQNYRRNIPGFSDSRVLH